MVISFIYLGEVSWTEERLELEKRKKRKGGPQTVDLKRRNACELGWAFLIPDEDMVCGQTKEESTTFTLMFNIPF